MLTNKDIIYQVFVRNYSKEGTFKSLFKDLYRIKSLGTTVLYLLPIHEIGVVNRKGTYGSPYSIKDYFSISKDLGTKEDFVELINETHRLGMKIIMDMVFNHTSHDSVLVDTHPEFYFYKNGKRGNRVGDWTDICDLETSREDVQEYLMSVIDYWVSLGVDGFRFDVASLIDINLFIKINEKYGKSLIMLAESIDNGFYSYLDSVNMPYFTDKQILPYFDCLYSYNYFREYISYIKGERSWKDTEPFIKNSIGLRLNMLENQDNDRIASIITDNDRLIEIYDYIYHLNGVKFLYNGQEYGITHKPDLFEKDPIDWSCKNERVFDFWMNLVK